MLVKDVMTTKLVTIGPDATVPEIAALLNDHRISAVPVVGPDGEILGIVSEGDLLRRPEIGTERQRSPWLEILSGGGSAGEYVKSHGHKASDIMTKKVIVATEDMTLAEVAAILEEASVKRLPVIRAGRLTGIVSRADIIRGLATSGSQPSKPPAATDEKIRQQALDAVNDQPWHNVFTSIIVDDGVIHLWGFVDSQDDRDAYRVAMEDTPGVKRVVDHRTQSGAWMYQE